MPSAPGSELLPERERQLFIDQFERDLKFFQLFFLLVNRSCPIRNIDMVWTESEPSGRVGLRHTGIVQALDGPCSRLLKCSEANPHPAFCNIVNDHGRRETETCGQSDRAAEDQVRRTGKPCVYRCHFGLTDIAVPVLWNGTLVATLYTGQVLREPASKEGFERIAASVRNLPHIHVAELDAAYWHVPLVSEDDIENTIVILEAFAEYLANSWTRLAEAIKEQRRGERESHLLRKEFAYLALEGTGDRNELREIMRKVGFTRPPNRVLVVRPETEVDYETPGASFDLGLTNAVQAVEEVCETVDNATAAYLRRRDICVFFDDRSREEKSTGKINARRIAARLLHAVRERCDVRVRIGIGSAKMGWRFLPDSHREAELALAGSSDVITSYRKLPPTIEALSKNAELLTAAIAAREFDQAKHAAAALPDAVQRHLPDNLPAQRVFFSSAMDSVLVAAQELGLERVAVQGLRTTAASKLSVPSEVPDLHEAFTCCANSVIADLRRLYASRRTKTIERACRIIEKTLQARQAVSIGAVASELGISQSHLSRTFHQVSGKTFEGYVMRQRVALARRLLLDPLTPIYSVAEACGFSDANYFARVFRKVAGCSPREYREDPARSARPGK